MTTAEQLTQIFRDNFVAYFRSHVAHVNIVGRTFSSDHALLGGIYEDLQGQIDHIAELLRTLQAFMPNSIAEILGESHIADYPLEGDSRELLEAVRDDLDHLKGCYELLIEVAHEEGNEPISNYAQDRVLALAKHIWMLDSTLA